MAVQVRLDAGIIGNELITDSGALILWLFVPLIAVATQYGLWLVVLFCIVTSGLEIFLGATLADSFGIATNILFEQMVIRNLVFLAIGFIISRLINEQRQQRASLRDANQQLAQYTVTLEQLTVSRERNRMARDLHDTLAHTLSAVSIQLEAVTTIWESSPDVARQRIEKIQGITRDGLNETRQALQALRSSPLEDLGLTMALHVMALKASERAGFRLHFTMPETMPDLLPEIELNLYRIAEEALNNAVQHAATSDLWFRLNLTDNRLILQIRDNGIGYDSHTSPPAGHFGLVGMRERAIMCGGHPQNRERNTYRNINQLNTRTQTMIKVMIVDDQALARDGLEVIVGSSPDIDIIGTAENGADALSKLETLTPDVVLMDLKMPILNGVQTTRRIREDYPDIRVLVLTTFDSDEWVVDAIRAGASGYLLKDSPREDIVNAIKHTASGGTTVSPQITDTLYRVVKQGITVDSSISEDLNEREREILNLLANGLTNADIATKIHLAEGTVRNYVSSIFTKLDVADRTQAAALAWRHGLVKPD